MGSKYAKLSDLMISDDFHDNSAIFQNTKQDTVFIFWGLSWIVGVIYGL